MTETDLESALLPETPLGDDLPPVQPPSAGFIVQLFLFPALIVMAVVAIWAMFGLIASGEQDWHKLLQDLQSQNIHIRKRAMYGLAQVLEQDFRMGNQGHFLCANREIARGLTDQLVIELRKNSTSKDGVAIQEYLTRLLGKMDPVDVTSPALQMAMESTHEQNIRACAIVSLSYAAGRARDRGESVNDPDGVEALVRLSTDDLVMLRQSAAYALGLFDSSEAMHQLEVLLENGDQKTRVNAAIGLARHESPLGYTVLRQSLKYAPSTLTDPKNREVEENDQLLIIKNVLKAVKSLAPQFDSDQRYEMIPLVEDLLANHPQIIIRNDAQLALNSLKEPQVKP